MGIPIRYNGFAGRQMLIGVGLGVLVGILYYVTTAAHVDSYGHDPRDEAALTLGISSAFLGSALADIVDRTISATRRRHGGAAMFAPDSGGHVWYVPMWIVGGLFGLLIASK